MDLPLRVLFLSERAPDSDALGGVEVHMADLIAGLPREIAPYSAWLRGDRLVVEGHHPRRRELASLGGTDLALAIETAVLALDVRLLHVHSPQIGPNAIADAAIATGVPVLLSLHDVQLEGLDAARLVDATRCFVAPSRFIRDALARAHPAIAERTRVVPWGVPVQQRARSSVSGPLRVAVVGVLAADKGSERLPQLMQACAGMEVDWHLFGATEGRSVRAIRRAARRVTFHGAYRRSELGAALDASRIDVALLASVVPESFSMTLSECEAAAVPVLASDVGALTERIRDEGCGWTFDPWQPESLARRLGELGDRNELGLVKRRLAQRVVRTPADMALEHVVLYRDLAGELPSGEKEAALQRFEAGRPRGIGALGLVWRSVRHSRLYRELPLRRMLPEALRARVERRAAALLDRLTR